MSNTVYVLACNSCNKIATENELTGEPEENGYVICICGCMQFEAVQLPEEMVQDGYLVVDGEPH